jgi:hypothetical protein
MPSTEVRTLVEPVISTITSLAHTQIDIAKKKGLVKIVYLVGGLDESAYLGESLKSVVPEDVQVIKPANAWTAVERGALIEGLAQVSHMAAKVKVGSCAARKAYGSVISEEFRAGVHHQQQRYVGRLPT